MQHLSDEDQKAALGEVLYDQLQVMLEYLKEIPSMKEEIHQTHAKVNEVSDRLEVIEHVVKDHEKEIKKLKRKVA